MSTRTKTDIMWAIHRIGADGKYLLALSREGTVHLPEGKEVRLFDFYSVFKMDEPIRLIAAVGDTGGKYAPCASRVLDNALRRPVRVEFEVEEYADEDRIAEIKIRLYKTDEEPKPIE